MARTFQQWKIWASAKLIEMIRNASDEKVKRDAEALLLKLQYLRLEGLPSFLVLLHTASSDEPRFLDLAPSAEEVEKWQEEVREE